VRTVFGEPIVRGETVIIPAAEVLSMAGFGRGRGNAAGGEGSGGGGWTLARPVGVIAVTGDTVRVLPLFDISKLILAALPFLAVLATLALRGRRR
jgi:uncharacterized spore protein YtfJ